MSVIWGMPRCPVSVMLWHPNCSARQKQHDAAGTVTQWSASIWIAFPVVWSFVPGTKGPTSCLHLHESQQWVVSAQRVTEWAVVPLPTTEGPSGAGGPLMGAHRGSAPTPRPSSLPHGLAACPGATEQLAGSFVPGSSPRRAIHKPQHHSASKLLIPLTYNPLQLQLVGWRSELKRKEKGKWNTMCRQCLPGTACTIDTSCSPIKADIHRCSPQTLHEQNHFLENT